MKAVLEIKGHEGNAVDLDGWLFFHYAGVAIVRYPLADGGAYFFEPIGPDGQGLDCYRTYDSLVDAIADINADQHNADRHKNPVESQPGLRVVK